MKNVLGKYKSFWLVLGLSFFLSLGLYGCSNAQQNEDAVDDEAGLGEVIDPSTFQMPVSPGDGSAHVAYSVDHSKLTEAVVSRVVDGDTIKVITGENEYKVRLIGINAPESVSSNKDKNCPEGREASNHLSKVLAPGTIVYLEQDVSDTDKYGRLLRYVWLVNPCEGNNSSKLTDNMVNAQLIDDGWVTAKAYKPDIKYAKNFATIEANQRSPYTSGKKARDVCK